MRWFRRRRSPQHDAASTGTELVPMASTMVLARNERALKMLAVQASQMQAHIVALDARVEALSASVLSQLDTPSYDDLLEARTHSAKVAAEVSRLEVNLAARMDALREEMRSATPTQPREIDLRELTPVDTGYDPGLDTGNVA